jgi:hypothetical protein
MLALFSLPFCRYQTKHGLSTKLLNVFDLELPPSFIPYNGDGEVESFHLMPLSEALHSLGMQTGGRGKGLGGKTVGGKARQAKGREWGVVW